MNERNYNRFDMTGSCTNCNESACAFSCRTYAAAAAQSTDTALLLTMDTVIAVSIFVALCAAAIIIANAAVIAVIISVVSVIIKILSAVIICVIAPPEYRPNRALVPLI